VCKGVIVYGPACMHVGTHVRVYSVSNLTLNVNLTFKMEKGNLTLLLTGVVS